MQYIKRSAALIALALIADAASAQDTTATSESRWRGFYIGANLGGAWNSTCNNWTPTGSVGNPTITTAFYNRDCPNNGTFVGGVQIGYNFQRNNIVWGFGLDYDAWSSETHSRSLIYTGALIPQGTYTFSSSGSPDGFGILGPRIGYAIDNWLPYFRVGSVFTSGSHKSTATFTGNNGSTAFFSGGKNFDSSGFAVGIGVEYALADPWSFRAEYTHVDLGKGSNTTTTCTGTAAACSSFTGISLDNIHNSFTAEIVRIGVNYKF